METQEYEAEIHFDVPAAGKACHTWHKVYGNLSSGLKTPLIILHGGPGACHEYLLIYSELTRRFGIPTVFYDQIGSGKSTHLREKHSDDSFWKEQLFRDKLDNLVDALGLHQRGFDILGHSWGGMFGSAYATTQPLGLRRMIITNSPAEASLWEEAARSLVKRLPADVQKVLENETNYSIDSIEYQQAMEAFRRKFFCKVEPWPAPEVQTAMGHLQEDPTSFATMKGFSEMSIAGNLKHWRVTDRLHKVQAPVLLINGVDDQAQDSAVLPFFQNLKKVKRVTLENASHATHLELPEKMLELVASFLLAEGI